MATRLRARLDRARLRRRSRHGFTFVELLVVVAALSVVGAAVAFTVRGIRPSSTTATCVANANSIRSAVDAYRATNGATATPEIDALQAAGLLARTRPNFTLGYSGTTVQLRGTDACRGLGD